VVVLLAEHQDRRRGLAPTVLLIADGYAGVNVGTVTA
jgi:hypothetical protein